MLCPPRQPNPCVPYAYGKCFRNDLLYPYPIPSNMSIILHTKIITSSENSTVKYIHLRFFDANTNKTIPDVSSYLNITQNKKTLFANSFQALSGELTLEFTQTNTTDTLKVNYTMNPITGVREIQDGKPIPVQADIGKMALYHLHAEVTGICADNDFLDNTKIPKFDSWWFVNEKGNISKFDIPKSHWMKNTYQWWLDGQISDQEFNNEVQYMMDLRK